MGVVGQIHILDSLPFQIFHHRQCVDEKRQGVEWARGFQKAFLFDGAFDMSMVDCVFVGNSHKVEGDSFGACYAIDALEVAQSRRALLRGEVAVQVVLVVI